MSAGWQQVVLGAHDVRWLAVLPSNPDLVYAAADPGSGHAGVPAVFRSSDGGRNWSPLTANGLSNNEVQAVAVCPDGTVFAATWGSGVFRYAGSAWQQIAGGLAEQYMTTLACDSRGSLFAGTFSKGVYALNSAGNGWVATNSGLGSLDVKVLRAHADSLYAGTGSGAFRLAAGSSTWTSAALAGQAVYDFEFDPADSRHLWAATTTQGVQVSTNAAASWTRVGAALSAYTVARDTSGQLYVGTRDAGVYSFNGTGWTKEPVNATKIFCVRSTGSGYGRMEAGTEGSDLWLRETAPPPSATPTSTPVAGIQASLRSSPTGAVGMGGEITYNIQYSIIGAAPLDNVVITGTIPSGTELLGRAFQRVVRPAREK